MKKTGIAELKNRLSYYLRYVRKGESVLVYDRDRAIARIDPVRGPVHGGGTGDWTAELESAGVLVPPTTPLPENWLEKRVPVTANVVEALLEERESGP